MKKGVFEAVAPENVGGPSLHQTLAASCFSDERVLILQHSLRFYLTVQICTPAKARSSDGNDDGVVISSVQRGWLSVVVQEGGDGEGGSGFVVIFPGNKWCLVVHSGDGCGDFSGGCAFQWCLCSQVVVVIAGGDLVKPIRWYYDPSHVFIYAPSVKGMVGFAINFFPFHHEYPPSFLRYRRTTSIHTQHPLILKV
ncbi:unnamed protein product [Lactuca saligna]|uniref:Uncharacterized protein n=1 Tax=Lactuca saligna TaxID=75948 RepID=A0AA35YAY6_LACSI|nr:unnamed protein product [Lactuca saligna]